MRILIAVAALLVAAAVAALLLTGPGAQPHPGTETGTLLGLHQQH